MLTGAIESHLQVYNFVLRKYDFRGWWSATLKNRMHSKETQGLKALKSRDGSWQWVPTFKQAVPFFSEYVQNIFDENIFDN